MVSLCVDDDKLFDAALDVAKRLAAGSPTAMRWTKYALNNWLRMMGPTFDTSLAVEFLGFTGPDVREGVASHRERRAPRFASDSPF
jgi:enoyl-CoA hydratase